MAKYLKFISIICLAAFLGFGVFAQDVFADYGKCATSVYDAETQMGGSSQYTCTPASDIVESYCDSGQIPYECVEISPDSPNDDSPNDEIVTDQGGCNPATGSGCIEERGLVPCGPATLGFYYKCDVCGMMKLVNNIIDFLIKVVTPALATMMIVIGAIFLMTAGGSETQLSKGKDYIKMALLGTTIVLTAWLIIDTIMKSFYDENKFGAWNEFSCSQKKN